MNPKKPDAVIAVTVTDTQNLWADVKSGKTLGQLVGQRIDDIRADNHEGTSLDKIVVSF